MSRMTFPLQPQLWCRWFSTSTVIIFLIKTRQKKKKALTCTPAYRMKEHWESNLMAVYLSIRNYHQNVILSTTLLNNCHGHLNDRSKRCWPYHRGNKKGKQYNHIKQFNRENAMYSMELVQVCSNMSRLQVQQTQRVLCDIIIK